ncbi:hypothetical protein, conserved [Babesia ovata]|uniref:6-Cys domain-containing protein n=1 Tax=Babesia ovata TaxID=189622 RepID=A0A2H6K6J9_9APIC|nr:uncharacterized protein BOVATA_001030 [Babesia ovata]GBE58610.1 hypothetical protein, conserved [Babesia ovata]
MAKGKMMSYLWAFCATWLFLNINIRAFSCDFGDPLKPLNRNALVVCEMDMDAIETAAVVCPNRVNDTEYIWHPQSTPNDQRQVKTYISERGIFRSVALSDVVLSESGVKLFRIDSPRFHTTLRIDLPINELFAITENRLIFICGPRDLVLSYELQRHLHRLGGSREIQSFPWMPPTPLTEEITKIGNGLGVVFVNRGRDNIPLQGCGSRPSALFAPDNVIAVDPVTGVRSCVVDPISETRIGFVCHGRLQPDDCMRSIINNYGVVVAAPPPRPYWEVQNYGPWVAARYFNALAVRPFNGECRCIDRKTGEVKARIEVRSKTDYVCDISTIIQRSDTSAINGPWCSVVLHPGSTLTIRFPTAAVDSSFDEGSSQLVPTGEFEAEFLPKYLATLRQLKTPYDVELYEEISYNKALAGDALELDVSQILDGEVKLKYHEGKPLTLLRGDNSFLYHWRLKPTNEDIPDKIRAVVKVSFAFTHRYKIVGCDREPQHVFDPAISEMYCSTKSMGNGIGNIYECLYQNIGHSSQVGIHCTTDEELLPTNCESTAYDLSSNLAMSFPESMRNATPYPIRGFQVFDIELNGDSPASYACVCVDQRGYEKCRLIVEQNAHQMYSFATYRRKVKTSWLLGGVSPGREVGLFLEVSTRERPIMFKHKPKRTITLHVGTTLSMTCDLDSNEQNGASEEVIPSSWWPKEPDVFYYTINRAKYGPQLFSKRYTDSIASTPNGFRITYNVFERQGFERVTIESRKGAILVSKDADKEYVSTMFVCGKLLEPVDIGVIRGAVPASARPHIVESSRRYKWHVVEVAVETTDPYMQGCGFTQPSVELFKPETPQLYDADGQPQFGCNIDLQAAKEAAFYCPAPYVLDPPNCFSQVYVEGVVKNTGELSKSLVASQSNHFVILSFDSSLVGVGETLHQTPPLQCRCVTIKGVVLSTIQIDNYYSN